MFLGMVKVDQIMTATTTTENYNSSTMAGAGANLIYNQERASKLKKARKEALEEFQKEMGKAIGQGLLNSLIPGSGTVMELLGSFCWR